MVIGHAARPAALVAGALTSPGTLNTLVLFTVVAAAELLLNDAIFICPCHSRLAIAYGLSFLLVPALILFLADFPWKLLPRCPSACTLCSLIRRPIGLAVIWIIIGLLQRRYVDCMIGEWADSRDHTTCEESAISSSLQLTALYVWLLIIVCTFALVLCRRRKASCIQGRGSALEMQIQYELQEKMERMTVEKKVKYGGTETQEGAVSQAELSRAQPGLTPHTFRVLQSEHLLQPSVLRYLRAEDLLSLDIPIAQRCLLRTLLDRLQHDSQLLTPSTCTSNKERPCLTWDKELARRAEREGGREQRTKEGEGEEEKEERERSRESE